MNQKDLDYGAIGEHKAWIEFLESDLVKNVLDVRKDEYFQKKDIDFLILGTNYSVTKIEVKTDSKGHTTRNIAFETISRGKQGCLARSEADWVYYYFEITGESFMINMRKLREYIEQMKPKEIAMGEDGKGYLLKIDNLVKLGIAKIPERRRNG